MHWPIGIQWHIYQSKSVTSLKFYIFIRLEARLQPNIGFTLWRVLAVFTHSAITQPKLNRFGWNLEHSEYILGGWPWQILGAIPTVATAGERQHNTWFHRFPVGQISLNLNTTCRSVSRWTLSEQNFEYFTVKSRFSKWMQKFHKNF